MSVTAIKINATSAIKTGVAVIVPLPAGKVAADFATSGASVRAFGTGYPIAPTLAGTTATFAWPAPPLPGGGSAYLELTVAAPNTIITRESLISGGLGAANADLGLGNTDAYLGMVANRCCVADSINAGLNSSIQGRWHIAPDDITSMVLVFGNFYCTTSAEATAGESRTISADVEYPIGTFTRVKFGGANTGTMADGAVRFLSDAVSVVIPRGALYRITTYQTSTGGILFAAGPNAYGVLGDQGTVGNGIADTTGTVWTGTAGGNPWGPYAVISLTRRPAVMLITDSRGVGTGMTSNSAPYAGELQPQIAPFYGCMSMGRGSMTAQQLASGQFAKRAEYLAYVTHAVLQIGTNDIAAGRTAVQVTADRQTIKANAPNVIWSETTLAPKTTSSDAFATVANQTVDATNAERIKFNDQVRARNIGFNQFFELADGVESSRNSGKYKAPPQVYEAITADGNHVNNAGYALQRNAIAANAFRR